MKKLVVMAAAMVAAIIVNAQGGYDVKVSVKTTGGKVQVLKDCVTSTNCYRYVTSAKFVGTAWITEDCDDSVLTLENSKTGDDVFVNDDIEFAIAKVIGSKDNEFEVAFSVEAMNVSSNTTAAAWFQGFGKMDKYDQLTSAKGSVQMFLPAPLCTSKCVKPTATYAYDLCKLVSDYDDMTIAFGDWSIKYNSKLNEPNID